MTDSKACQKCDETKPLDAFYEHVRTNDGLTHVCIECIRPQSYIDYDAPESTPPCSAKRLARHHKLTLAEREIAEGAVKRVLAFRARDRDDIEMWEGWEGETASEYVDEEMPDASTARRSHVLTVAIRLADERTGEVRSDVA